jgi:signal transduction histidine kinase
MAAPNHQTSALPSRQLTLACDGEALAAAEFNRSTASFLDPRVEDAYRRHLVTADLPRQRVIWLVMSLVYLLYGILDVLTIQEHLYAVLAVRWLLITPLAVALCGLTFIDRIKPYTGQIFAICVFLSAISVTWMISILPTHDAPPYIVGILIVFIFSSCNVQMPFMWATSAYTLTTIAYSFVMLSNPDYSRTDVISGHFFMISSAAAAIATNYVQELRLRNIWLNVERRKLDAERIEELMIEATAADNSKLNFISILTHELRTPLHQVIGLSEVVRNQVAQNNKPDLAEMLTQVIGSAHGLLTKIGQMLRYADATAGRLAFECDYVPARDIAEKLFDQFAAKAGSKSVSLTLDAIERADIYVDAHHTSYALANLVDNAINGCEENGHVSITGALMDDGRYVMEFIDDGVGISKEKLASIFAPFTQGEESYARKREGVGLGLTLANRLLTSQDATLELFAHPERGTIARVTFTKRQEEKGDDTAAAA